jgi:hypothetical protein
MVEFQQQLVSLLALARATGLPADWLKQRAIEGHIPCLHVGRRMLFNPAAVQEALLLLAATPATEATR